MANINVAAQNDPVVVTVTVAASKVMVPVATSSAMTYPRLCLRAGIPLSFIKFPTLVHQ